MKPALASLIAAASMVGACGQKGPLYLPGDPDEVQTEIPPEPAVTEPLTDTKDTDDPPDTGQ